MSAPEPLLREGLPPRVIAHRGASAAAPENTLRAFRRAWRDGARWLETDVQPSADGTPVLLHDARVDRTTDGAGAVRALTLADLRGLDAGARNHPRHPSTAAPPARTGAPDRIPTLAELLAAMPPDGRVLLEIKGRHRRTDLEQVLAVINEAGAAERVVLQSFGIGALRLLRELLPAEPLGLLVERIHADPVTLCRQLGAITYNPGLAVLRERPEVVARLHEAGIAVIVWTANEPRDWVWLAGLGVDGVFTDRPAEMAAWLAER